LDYKKVCQLPFGAYVHVHDDLDITNTMESRITGAINLGPMGNVQGTHRFLSLKTGELLARRRWRELPVPSDVVHRLEELAGESENVSSSLIDVEGDDYDHSILDNNAEEEMDNHDLINRETSQRDKNETAEEVVANDGFSNENAGTNYEVGMMQNELVNVNDASEEEIEFEKENKKMTTHSYGLRENRERDSHCIAFLSVNAGLKRWGDRAKEALMDDLKLFLKENVFETLNEPSDDQKKMALRMHCLIVEKRDG
jgi:hypothetical protein